MLRIHQADVRDSRSQGTVKRAVLSDATEGVFPCKALLEDPLWGHGYSLSAEAGWLCLTSE